MSIIYWERPKYVNALLKPQVGVMTVSHLAPSITLAKKWPWFAGRYTGENETHIHVNKVGRVKISCLCI